MAFVGVVKVGRLVVVSLVTQGRNGECEGVEILTAAGTRPLALRAIRAAGYHGVKRLIDDGHRLDEADIDMALNHPGIVYERLWGQRGSWTPAGGR